MYACPYCDKEVPDGVEPATYMCCGEVHCEEVDPETRQAIFPPELIAEFDHQRSIQERAELRGYSGLLEAFK